MLLGGWQSGFDPHVAESVSPNGAAGRDQCDCAHQSDRVDATGQGDGLGPRRAESGDVGAASSILNTGAQVGGFVEPIATPYIAAG